MKRKVAGAFKIDTLIYDDEKLDAQIAGIARKVMQERESRGLSISELAALANLSTSVISKGETGKSTFSLRSLIKIAAALNVSVKELFQVDDGNKDCSDSPGNEMECIIAGMDEWIIKTMIKIAESIIEGSKKQDGKGNG